MSLRPLLLACIFIAMADAFSVEWTSELVEQFRDRCGTLYIDKSSFRQQQSHAVQERHLPSIGMWHCEGGQSAPLDLQGDS
jgi:hypothetical protein